MKTRFIIDLTTGLVSRSIAGAAESCDWAATLIAGDTMDCEVVFMANDADVTTTTLAGDVIATLGVRAVPGVEPLLAMSTPIALGEDGVGTCTLDLHTAEIVALVNALDATKTSTKVWFEAVIGGLTVTQQRMTLRREVIAEGDEPPATAEASRISASASAAAAQASADAAASSAAAASAAAGSAADSATAASSAATAAIAARDAAQAAQTAATAAQTAAQAARDAAAGSATAAATAQTAAETARDAAQAAQTAAVAAKTAAETAATNAGTSATSAGNSATAAATSATSAGTSAASAAASAALASAIAAANLYPLVFSLTARDSLFSDGVNGPGRGVAWSMGSAGAMGGRAASIPAEIIVPTSNPGVDAYLFLFGPVISGGNVTSYTAPWMLLMTINTSGALVLRQGGAASTAADFRQLSYAGFRAAFTGLRARICVIFASPDSATAPVIYINGIDVTASFVATSGGTVPNWFPAALDTTRYYVGYNWPMGCFQPQAPILGALTAAEVLDWTTAGHFPTWCEIAAASAVDCIVAQANRDFSGAGNWATFGTGATAAVNAGALDVTLPGAGSVAAGIGLSSIGSMFSNAFPTGHRYRLSGTVSNWVKTSGAGRVSWFWSSIGAEILTLTGNGVFSVEFTISTAPSGGASLRLGEYGAAWAGSFTLDNISVIELGPIFRPIIQPIGVIADAGKNRIVGLLTACWPLTDRRDWVIQADTNLAGNQQLLGASVFASTGPHVLDDWCMEIAGTPTVTAGSASGSSAYKTSGALAATKNFIALVTRVLASVNLWVSSTTTDTIRHTIRGHRVD